MKNQTYMEKLYQLATGKKNPLDVFGPQVGEQVTPQLGPEMPPPGFPSPLKYPPSEETVDVVRKPLPVKVIDTPQFATLSTNQDLINALPSLSNLFPSNILSRFKSSKEEYKMPPITPAPKIEAGNKKVEDLSQKPVPSTEAKAAPNLIEATIKTAKKLNSSEGKLPIPSDKRATALPYSPAEDIKAATSEATGTMKPGIADAEQGKALEQAQRDQSRDILQDFILTKTFPDQRPPSRAGELLQELLFETQQRVKEFDPNSVERKQLNRLTEAILAFGGPLLGALTGGTAGLMAGSAAGQAGLQTLAQARKDLEADYQTRMKFTALNLNEQLKSMNRDQIERLKALMGLEKLDADEFKTRLQYETQILRTQMELAKAAFGFDSREHIEAKKLYYNFVKAFSDLLVKGTTAAATTATKADQAEKDRESREKIKAQEFDLKRAAIEAKRKAAEAKAKNPKLTSEQGKAVGFYFQAKPANDQYWDFVVRNNYKIPGVRSTFVDTVAKAMRDAAIKSGNPKMRFTDTAILNILPRTLNEAERREITYRLGFILPVLRADTGAAIAADEWVFYNQTYFPGVNATKNEQIEKNNMRLNAIEALRVRGGEENIERVQNRLVPLSQGTSTNPATTQEAINRLEKIRKRLGK